MILLVFIVVCVVSAVFANIVESFKESEPALAFLFWIISFAVSTFLSIGFVRCLLQAVDGKQITFSELFSGGDIFLVFLLGSIAYGLVCFGGYLLLIVPGIIWSIKFSFVQYLIADKRMGVKEAFSKSGAITDGYKWKLLYLGFFIGLLNIAGLLCLGVGLLVTLPWTCVIYPLVYRQLTGELNDVPEQADEVEGIQGFHND